MLEVWTDGTGRTRPAPKEPNVKYVEIELPSGGGGSPSCDMMYDEACDRVIRQAIPLGARYLAHKTKTIHKIVATVAYLDAE